MTRYCPQWKATTESESGYKCTELLLPHTLHVKVYSPQPGIPSPSQSGQPCLLFPSLCFHPEPATIFYKGRCCCTSVPLLLTLPLPRASFQTCHLFKIHFKCSSNHIFIQQMLIDCLMWATLCSSGHWLHILIRKNNPTWKELKEGKVSWRKWCPLLVSRRKSLLSPHIPHTLSWLHAQAFTDPKLLVHFKVSEKNIVFRVIYCLWGGASWLSSNTASCREGLILTYGFYLFRRLILIIAYFRLIPKSKLY